MTKIKLVLAATVALVAMAFAVSSASAAYTGSLSPGGTIASTASSLTFSDSGGLINIVCPVTLTGSLLTGPIATTAGSNFGTVTRVAIGTCRNGSAAALVGTGWAMNINTVLGTLPNAATGLLIDIVGASFNIRTTILGITVNCLYRGTAGALIAAAGTNPYTVGSIAVLSGVSVPFSSGDAVCPSSGRLTGTFGVPAPAQTLTIT